MDETFAKVLALRYRDGQLEGPDQDHSGGEATLRTSRNLSCSKAGGAVAHSNQLEHLVKMIIYRHKFSGFVAMPASTADERARHLDLCRKAMQCALTIIADHVHIVSDPLVGL